jgi:hypothetical protein
MRGLWRTGRRGRLVGRLREHFEAEARTVEEGVDLGVDLGLRTATMSGPGIRIIH